MAQIDDEEVKEELLTRLRTVKGHINGIEEMVEKEKDCTDLLIQLSAIKSSINKIGMYLLENNACQCIADSVEQGEDIETAVQDALETMFKFTEDFE